MASQTLLESYFALRVDSSTNKHTEYTEETVFVINDEKNMSRKRKRSADSDDGRLQFPLLVPILKHNSAFCDIQID